MKVIATFTEQEVTEAIRIARNNGEFDILRRYFESDYKKASRYTARTASQHPEVLNIKQDTQRGGFLEQLVNNVLSGPNSQTNREYLARLLAKVVPRSPLGVIEHAIYIATDVFTNLLPISDSYAIRATESVTYKLFGKKRKTHLRELLYLSS